MTETTLAALSEGGARRLTRDAVKAAGNDIVAKFNELGPQALKLLEVRRSLADGDGLWTVGDYLAQLKGARGIHELRLELARDTELLKIGSPRKPLAWSLAYNGSEQVHLELLKNEEALRMNGEFGSSVVGTIRQRGGPKAQAGAERFILKEMLKRSGSLEPREIRYIASSLRTDINESGLRILDTPEKRPLLFASMDNGWTVAHKLVYGKETKAMTSIKMHFAEDKEILSIASKGSSANFAPITIESMLREGNNAAIIQRIEKTLRALKRE